MTRSSTQLTVAAVGAHVTGGIITHVYASGARNAESLARVQFGKLEVMHTLSSLGLAADPTWRAIGVGEAKGPVLARKS